MCSHLFRGPIKETETTSLQKGTDEVCVVDGCRTLGEQGAKARPTYLPMPLFHKKHYFMLSHTTGARYKRPWTRRRPTFSDLIWIAGWLIAAIAVLSLVPFVQSGKLGASCVSQLVTAAFDN